MDCAVARSFLRSLLLLALGCNVSEQRDNGKDEIDALIEGLVVAPTREAFMALGEAEWTARYDRAAPALDRLVELGVRAFPRLVEHLDDPRAATNWGARLVPSLGVTCFDLIEGPVIPEMIITYRSTYSFLAWGLAREWWSERSAWPLRELQVEAALFALALARHDAKADYAAPAARRLGELGVTDPEARMEPFRKAFAGLVIPDDPDALIAAFTLPPGTYLQRRVALERRGRAQHKLLELGLGAFPALLRHLEDPAVGDRCFGLIQTAVMDDYHDDHPELTLLSKATLASWLKKRAGRTLKELRIEVVHHCIETATRTEYKTAEDKKNLLEFLQEHLERILKE